MIWLLAVSTFDVAVAVVVVALPAEVAVVAVVAVSSFHERLLTVPLSYHVDSFELVVREIVDVDGVAAIDGVDVVVALGDSIDSLLVLAIDAF